MMPKMIMLNMIMLENKSGGDYARTLEFACIIGTNINVVVSYKIILDVTLMCQEDILSLKRPRHVNTTQY